MLLVRVCKSCIFRIPQSLKNVFCVQIESARKDVECLFGMMKMRFSVLKHPIVLHDLDEIQNMIHACCILWNLQRRNDQELELGDSEFWTHLEDGCDSQEDDMEVDQTEEKMHERKMLSFFERDLRSEHLKASATLRGDGNHVGPFSIQWGPQRVPNTREKQLRAELRAKLVVDFEYRVRTNKLERIRTKKHRARERQAYMDESD